MMEAIAEEKRVCSKCGIEKPASDFSKNGKWYRNECKVCCYTTHLPKGSTRVCLTCGLEKPITSFQRSGGTRRRVCWPCQYDAESEKRKQRFHNRYYNILRPNNLAEFGVVYTPEQKSQVRERIAARVEEFGCTYTPKEQAARLVRYVKLRSRALALYGGKCECCGESRYEMLTFDHKEKIYYKDKTKGIYLVYEVIREYGASGYPNDKYRVLCWNCNMSMGLYDHCPHNKAFADCEHDYLKQEIIDAYGGHCLLCGEDKWEFLTIDHTNGGGNQHRAHLGMNIYLWLQRQGYPKKEYRLLCANCNCSMKKNKWSAK